MEFLIVHAVFEPWAAQIQILIKSSSIQASNYFLFVIVQFERKNRADHRWSCGKRDDE